MKGLFITGTDTEVGKTAVAAACASVLGTKGINVGVMKPIATGCLRRNGMLISEDAELLLKASGVEDAMDLVSPYRYEPSVAPYVVLHQKRQPVISFEKIGEACRELARRHEFMLIEGIGGLAVPLDEERTVADLAAYLRFPLLIVARAGLGTINHTVLTIEAARNAGLHVLGVVLNGRSRTPSYAERTNPDVIRKLGRVPVFGVIPTLDSPRPLEIAKHLHVGEILNAFNRLEQQRTRSHKRLSLLDRTKIWHPFTQMSEWEKTDPLIIDSADGIYLTDTKGRRFLDGVSSLWVNVHGHREPQLDKALRRQIGKIAHSTLLGAANVPSIELADELLRSAPKGLARVFYSDSGSTAVEIALKMAFQYWQQNGAPERKRFIHFENAYHGDTIGSVSVGGIDLFHKIYGPLLFKGYKVPSPYGYRCSNNHANSICTLTCLKPFEQALRKYHRQIAAVIVEPLVQGASGMITQPPGWLKKVERLCRRYGVFLIADEVAVGFGRTGKMFACEWEGIHPDFLCVAKGLTGGYLPLAATLTTEKIYRGFLGSPGSLRTFFHGHSYTGNPLACVVALENLKIFQRRKVIPRLKPKIRLLSRELEKFRQLTHVGDIRQRGLMAGIELVADKKTKEPYPLDAAIGIRVCQFLRGRGILLRPLGNVIVLMPPLSISQADIRFLCREVGMAIQAVTA